jgi:hypothetical protein
MRTPSRHLVLLALCLVPASLAIAAAAPATASPLWCPQSASVDEIPSGLAFDLDPLQGAEQQTCSAIATCNTFPSVSCVGVDTCSSYNHNCPNQWRGLVICDGVYTHCDVNEACVDACDAERLACRNGCSDQACLYQCQIDHVYCLCNCS